MCLLPVSLKANLIKCGRNGKWVTLKLNGMLTAIVLRGALMSFPEREEKENSG